MSKAKEITALRREVREMHEIRDRLITEQNQRSAELKHNEALRLYLYKGYIAEREELMSRVHQIDIRIEALAGTVSGARTQHKQTLPE